MKHIKNIIRYTSENIFDIAELLSVDKKYLSDFEKIISNYDSIKTEAELSKLLFKMDVALHSTRDRLCKDIKPYNLEETVYKLIDNSHIIMGSLALHFESK